MRLKSNGAARFTAMRAGALVLWASTSAGVAQPTTTRPGLSLEESAAVFGARKNVLNMSLSPDGTKLATLMPDGARGSVLRILDLASTGEAKRVLSAAGDPERLSWCRWAGNSRLLCSAYASTMLDTGDMTYVSRMIAISPDGGNMQMLRTPRGNGQTLGYTTFGGAVLDWNTGEDGHVLMIRRYIPEFSTGTRNAQTVNGLGVDDINSANLSSRRRERPRPNAVEFISDGRGRVRIIGTDPSLLKDGYNGSLINYQYRPKNMDEWRPLGSYDRTSGDGFNPFYVDPALDVAYGLKRLDGRLAAYSLALDGSAKETLLFSHPAVDIDGFATIGRDRRVIGVTYTTDRSEVVYFDPQIKRLAIGLAKALPSLPLIRFIDSSQDERKLLVWAGSDVDPGHYYVLDRDKGGMEEVAVSRQHMERLSRAPVKPVTYPAADGTPIPAYLTLPVGTDGKNLPAIVLPHGGPSARDEWGFDWLAQFWASRGYAVLQPNFRGSAGYGDAWFRTNGFQGWRMAIGDVADGGRWLEKEGISEPGKLAVFGWSYGGYAALQAAATEPDLFRAVIAVAPVTDLGRLKQDSANFSNYRLERDFIGSGPHVAEGSPARQAAKIKAPVMLFHGAYDENVNVRHSRLMADRLREAGKAPELVIYDKLDHYLEDSAARQDMLLKSATFVEKALGNGR